MHNAIQFIMQPCCISISFTNVQLDLGFVFVFLCVCFFWGVFNGEYVTGDVDTAYLNKLDKLRNDKVKSSTEGANNSGGNAMVGIHNDE